MRNILIKIGKAANVLKRDGFFGGFKRIFLAFFAQFKRVDAGEVLLVTGGVGDSARYRAENVAEELRQNDILASVAYADNPFLLKYARSFKVFIFHRVAYSKKIKKFIDEIKKQGKEIIFDTDDLLYEAEFIRGTDYFKNINSFEKKLYENGLGSEIINDPYVRVCTTTTSFLADKLREKEKKVFLVPNKLSLEDLEIVGKVLGRRKEKNAGNVVRFGYFSGTPSHNKDFATISGALMRVMERHKNVELAIYGPLDLEDKFKELENQVKKYPFAKREKHFENLSSVDINLAPLVPNDPYCEAKSELKFFEAAILGIPTVAVANRTFSEAIENGLEGLLASKSDEWADAMEKLILEPNLRLEMGQKAREKALAKYTTKNGKNPDYYNFLKSKII